MSLECTKIKHHQLNMAKNYSLQHDHAIGSNPLILDYYLHE